MEAGIDGVEIRQITCGGSYAVTPDSFSVTRGSYVSGGVVELAASDNADLSLRRATADIRVADRIRGQSNQPDRKSFLAGSDFGRFRVCPFASKSNDRVV